MADTRACFDAGHLGAVHAGADEALAAPGDQQVHKAAGLHQVGGTGAGGILHQIHQRAGRSAVLQPRAQRGDNGCIGADGLLAAAQDAYVAALQAERGGVRRHIGAALVDNGNHAHGHANLADDEPVGPGCLAEELAHRVRQCGDGAHALGHAFHARGRERETVDHDRGDHAARGLHIRGVGRKDIIGVVQQSLGHGLQQTVFLSGGKCGRGRFYGAGGAKQIGGGHVGFLL